MVQSYKIKSKAANAIVFLAGLITYIGKDALVEILPKELAYLSPIIVLIAGYVVVQSTENTRVERAEKLAVINYEAENNQTIDPAAEYSSLNTNDAVGEDDVN
ncbi:MAG: hypothetical protein IJ104_00650 [Methanobrevibacter sp.]|nr:hypothetical protein [Methanobrevibacter sp.]MBQ9024878.1 hypothetical protein [Methanobrevibacter sp.]